MARKGDGVKILRNSEKDSGTTSLEAWKWKRDALKAPVKTGMEYEIARLRFNYDVAGKSFGEGNPAFSV